MSLQGRSVHLRYVENMHSRERFRDAGGKNIKSEEKRISVVQSEGLNDSGTADREFEQFCGQLALRESGAKKNIAATGIPERTL